PNHAGTASGPNNLQNFPVLAAAEAGATTSVRGTLNSRPGTTFTLDFYASPAADPSGYGEGQRYLGSATVNTDAAGTAALVAALAATSPGEVISATATDPQGNTSEFSADVPARPLTASAGGPYTIAEGDSLTLDASATSNPAGYPLT